MTRQRAGLFDSQMFYRTTLRQSQQWFLCVIVLTVILVLFYEIRYSGTSGVLSPPRMVQQSTVNRVTIHFKGRNGNHMFEYATLLGTAARNNMTPILVENTGIKNCYKLKIPFTNERSLGVYKNYKEKLAAAYYPGFEHLDQSLGAFLDGYVHSWKYFENVKHELLHEHFIFHDHIQKEANEFVSKAKADHKMVNPVLVGVHIRRGDFVRQVRSGYGAATVSYLYRAMNYYVNKYKNVLFIVCSNDIIWSQDVLDAEHYNIQYSYVKDGFVDLAILANCQHAIITVGSYSWWAGYLTGGDVVYYKEFPTPPHTLKGSQYVREDYYPPAWVPL